MVGGEEGGRMGIGYMYRGKEGKRGNQFAIKRIKRMAPVDTRGC